MAAPMVDNWNIIRNAFFVGIPLEQANQDIQIVAPTQAEDASLVPVKVLVALPNAEIKRIYLFTDANPILLTAIFSPVRQQRFAVSTRIRLESNSLFRVVVQTSNDQYLMTTAPIKTPGGGCGGGLDPNEAALRASAGQMKLQRNPQAGLNEITLHIKHPMRTGFERTTQGYYAKAWFMNHLTFSHATEPFLHVELGPGISANPYFKFEFDSISAASIGVIANDNEDNRYQQTFAIPAKH